MTTLPFDLTAQTKAATDQLLTLLSQTQKATIAGVKTVTSLTGPLVEKLPAMPYAPETADVKALVDGGYAALTAFLDSQKAFTAELFELMTPAKPAPATKK